MEDPNTGRMVVDPASFSYVDADPTGFFELFMSVSKGIQGSSSIIAFLFIIGGAFGIMEETGRDPRRNGHPGPQNEGA